MDPPSIQTVYEAINALYNNPNTSEKEKASSWLGEVQKSIHAWKICDTILTESNNVQSSYFAAQTMRSKIHHSFRELPQESYDSLTNSLTSHIQKISPETSTIIITQLAIALADLVLQLPSWKENFNKIIGELSTNHAWALLEFLTVFPQEIDAPTLRLGENRRQDIRVELRSNSASVDEFLKQCLLNCGKNPNIVMKIFKCFNSWIQINAVRLEDLQKNLVLEHCFQVLNELSVNNMLHEAATDCVCALLESLFGYATVESIGELIYRSVAGLEKTYHLSVAQEDQEKSINFCRLFTELAEAFLTNIIMASEYNNQHYACGALDLVLLCVGHHDYEIAEITFNLWYRMSEEFYDRNDAKLTEKYAHYITRLITALYRHCEIESDTNTLLEEGDEFYDFRLKVQEVVIDVAFIMGSSNIFALMFSKLRQPNLTWEQTEAALFIMQAVARNILPSEETIVPQVMEALLAVPQNAHVAVRQTCILLLGELGDWVGAHPACLPSAVGYLMQALSEPVLASSAATALQNICKSCGSAIAPQLSALLQLCRGLDSLGLTAEASLRLLRASALVISTLPPAQAKLYMTTACKPLAESLSQTSDPIIWLDRIAALFKETEFKLSSETNEHPFFQAFCETWPCLSAAMDRFSTDGKVVERLCRTIRFCIRCIGKYAQSVLPSLVEKIIQVYTAQGHSCFLYLSSILVDEFSTTQSSIPMLTLLLQSLMPKAFHQLQQENGLKNNPDTVDDLFRLVNRFVQRIPKNLLECPVMGNIMECAVMACMLDHRDANSSVLKFILDFTHLSQTRRFGPEVKKPVEVILDKYGQHLISTLIHSMIYYLHPLMLEDVAAVILELLFWNKSKTGSWLEEALTHLQRNATEPKATDSQILHFHACAMRSISHKELINLVHEFARLYR